MDLINKKHIVLNKQANFPAAYWCIYKQPHIFIQQGSYEKNFQVANWTDLFGADEAMNHSTSADVVSTGFIDNRPSNTDVFTFLSKNAPVDMTSKLAFSDNGNNVVPDQDSTISAVIRAHNLPEAQNMFNKIKNTKLDYSKKPGKWSTSRDDGTDK